MEQSILNDVKKVLGPSGHTAFDADIILQINSAFATLHQLGVGPDEGFSITGDNETWLDYLGEEDKRLNFVKTYLYLWVRKAFDPPTNGTVMNALNEQLDELTFRLNIIVDPKTEV